MQKPVTKIALTFFLLIPLFSYAVEANPTYDPQQSEEALFARRIVEFWKDGDNALSKSQIDQFFQLYPYSPYKESLLALLGEIYTQEKNYGKALSFYNQISSLEEKEKIAPNRLECLYRLGMHAELKRELSERVPQGDKLITHKEPALHAFVYAELLMRDGEPEKKEEARKLYQRLLQSEHRGEALLALGDIAFQNNEFFEAAKYYGDASALFPKREEELLLLSLQLLFQEGKHREVLEKRKFYRARLKDKADPILGRAYFATGQYLEALLFLTPQMSSGDKQTLLTLLSAAYEVEDFPLVIQAAEQLIKSYPSDPSIAPILYMQALALQRLERYAEAENLYVTLQREHPQFEKQEEVAYDLAYVLFEQKRWDESHDKFHRFIEQFPQSIWVCYALYYLPETALQGDKAFKELFADIDLFLTLNESNQEKGLTLAKIAFGLYDKKKYQESVAVAEKILQLKPSNQLQAQLHFLLAAIALEQLNDEPQFTQHAEKVLELRPDFPGKERLREKLIHSYLQKKNKAAAARQLYTALEEKEELTQELILWLGNYYYEQAQEQVPEAFYGTVHGSELLREISKGIIAFEAILGSDPVIHPGNLSLEQEYFKLSNLYAWRGQHEAQVVLLQNLHEQQQKNPEWKWTLPTKTMTALAEGYRVLGDQEKALQAYGEIIRSKTCDTASTYRAKLEWVRLQKNGKFALNDSLAIELLKNLKDLQIKKNIKYEPIHLEAALEYAHLRANFEPEERRDEHYYLLVQRIKEDFTEKKDLISKEYHTEREKNLSQNQVYQAYMMLIDAELFRFEGREDPLKMETAAALYQSLLTGKFAVSKYLIDQAQSGIIQCNHALN